MGIWNAHLRFWKSLLGKRIRMRYGDVEELRDAVKLAYEIKSVEMMQYV